MKKNKQTIMKCIFNLILLHQLNLVQIIKKLKGRINSKVKSKQVSPKRLQSKENHLRIAIPQKASVMRGAMLVKAPIASQIHHLEKSMLSIKRKNRHYLLKVSILLISKILKRKRVRMLPKILVFNQLLVQTIKESQAPKGRYP